MALSSDAAMVLFYDIAGDPADHDDWHSREHLHERLSVPGFLRATRWIATGAGPRHLVIYEVADVGVATSPAYLDRLNGPTSWTGEMMPRFRGMVRGFCHVAASAGFGLGAAALALRFAPGADGPGPVSEWLAREALPAIAAQGGVVGAHLLRPAPPPPMTREQALRGPDAPMPWLLVATGHDRPALDRAARDHLRPQAFARHGATLLAAGTYALHHTATAAEVARTPKTAEPPPDERRPR